MPDFSHPTYDLPREWIQKRKLYKPEDPVLSDCGNSEEEVKRFLKIQHEYNNWPDMTIDEWRLLVRFVLEPAQGEVINDKEWIAGAELDNGVDHAPTQADSSWQRYKNYLLDNKHFSSEVVNEMELATLRIMRRVRSDNLNGPGRGLVMGNVQSGKTANIAALMAMAADYGWNFFVVLSGTIENLRLQTQNRLFADLNRPDCRITWEIRERLNPTDNDCHRRPDSLLLKNSTSRYFVVCLKNSTNLQNLVNWLRADENVAGQLKLMVIDDECDQAGINTADITTDEATRINQLIKDLVHCRKFGSLNYVGYTATPYANVLNEAGEKSLYPEDFLAVLKVSKEYFGPQQIFGSDEAGYDGLNILREISPEDNESIIAIHNNETAEPPQSLKDAVCWFMCCVACRRFWGDKSPVTLLVHTNHRTDAHSSIANAIANWLNTSRPDELIAQSIKLWNQEREMFTKEDLFRGYPDYSGDRDLIKELPMAEDLEPKLRELLKRSVSPIEINADGELCYHNGIHLCIDNSQNNGNTDGQHYRLIYPHERNNPGTAAAFIVIGGATMSRGLTLEGLVGTYFLRTTKTYDTLMQMGRWFGYRRGYELLPRIWMTADTRKKFEFLSEVDHDLRTQIHTMAATGATPREFGPKIMVHSTVSVLRVVADNRRQGAVDANVDFYGSRATNTVFRDVDNLSANLRFTREFICGLGKPDAAKDCNSHSKNAFIWRNVDNEKVAQFIKTMHFHPNLRFFNDIDPFIRWLNQMFEDNKLRPWNVVLAGKAGDSNGVWKISEDLSVNKVSRTSPTSGPNIENGAKIQHLVDPTHKVIDVDLENADEELKTAMKSFASCHTTPKANLARHLNGLDSTPRLLIYIVDKDSSPQSEESNRCALNAPVDIVGIEILIPTELGQNDRVRRITMNPDWLINSTEESN